MTVTVILACVAALFAAAAVGVAAGRHPLGRHLVYGLGLAATSVACIAAVGELAAPADPGPGLVLPLGLPWLGAHFRVDALSAFFLAVVNLGAAAACLYGLGQGRHEPAPHRVLPLFPAFLAGMNLVVLAADAFGFLLSWEFMSLASWALVMAHHRDPGNARAGYVYLVMASFGTLALLLTLGLLAGPDGGYAFADMRLAGMHTSGREPQAATLILVLALIGAGSKAGVVPLHVWLPLAHPAAPSHVSALMSGVMTKVAVYGFVRITFDLLGPSPWWSSLIVLGVGGASAVLGVLFALMQTDLKRLLAYSTIENIGIVFVALGLALAFRANGLELAAALAFTAALLHVLNHSLFKSLLFFGAGAVMAATGERDVERLGGLIHRMPSTSALFLVGCVAISALPPLNGFVSEWLAFQAVLQSPDLPQWGLRVFVPAIGGLLALAAALAGACFVRAYGICFLGRPRSTAAVQAHETDRLSVAAMAALALLCLLAGIMPGTLIDALAPVAEAAVGGRMPAQQAVDWLTIVPIAESRSSYNGLLVFLFIATSATLAVLAIHRFAGRAVRRAPPWDCGFPDPSPAAQYTAGSFAQPIRRVFGPLLFRTREQVEMPPPGDLRPARLTVAMRDLVWDWLYVPIGIAVGFAADRMNRLQFLTIRRYLGMVFLSLVGLLLVIAIWR